MANENYLRIESTVYLKVEEGETPERAKARFLRSLPSGSDCVSYKVALWDSAKNEYTIITSEA